MSNDRWTRLKISAEVWGIRLRRYLRFVVALVGVVVTVVGGYELVVRPAAIAYGYPMVLHDVWPDLRRIPAFLLTGGGLVVTFWVPGLIGRRN